MHTYVYGYLALDPFSIRKYYILDPVSCTSYEPRTPFMIVVDMPISMPMNSVTKHTNISFYVLCLLFYGTKAHIQQRRYSTKQIQTNLTWFVTDVDTLKRLCYTDKSIVFHIIYTTKNSSETSLCSYYQFI